jgi:thiamine-monophosphate kinase
VFELFEPDYWHFGWMTLVINLSDLASMGADPAGILISTVMPNDMSTRDYRRFWDGVIDASDAWNCKVLGGNIKDGQKFSAEGSAFGWCADRSVMRRSGSSDGDLVYVIGDMGLFWSAVLHGLWTRELPLTDVEQTQSHRALNRPVPRIKEGKALAASGLVTACMDASDGVLGTLTELGRVNKLDVYLIEPKPSPLVDKVASQFDLPPLKLMLSWGDWQLVATIREETQSEFEVLARSFGTPVTLIGRMKPGSGCVWSRADGPLRQLSNLSSERFTKTSYFTSGIKEYVKWFVQAPLYMD